MVVSVEPFLSVCFRTLQGDVLIHHYSSQRSNMEVTLPVRAAAAADVHSIYPTIITSTSIMSL